MELLTSMQIYAICSLKHRYSYQKVRMHGSNYNEKNAQFINRLMQMNSSVRYHLTPVRLAIIERQKNSLLAKMQRKGYTKTVFVETQIRKVITENRIYILQNANHLLPGAPIVPLLGIYPRKMKLETNFHVYSSSIHNSQK